MEVKKMDNNELLQAIRKIVKDEIEPLKQEVLSIKLTQENVTNKNIQLLMEGQQGMNEKFKSLDVLEDKVEDIQTTVSVLKALTVKK
jgi:hypothetical protein